MANHMMTESGTLANAAVLAIEAGASDDTREADASRVSERFLRAAALLPEGAVLGWQIAADRDNTIAGYAFSSAGIRVTSEDYNWIFKSCAAAEGSAFVTLQNLYEGDRKVYRLSSVSGRIHTSASVTLLMTVSIARTGALVGVVHWVLLFTWIGLPSSQPQKASSMSIHVIKAIVLFMGTLLTGSLGECARPHRGSAPCSRRPR